MASTPGTYTGFVKAGRKISVPVVIRFIPIPVTNDDDSKGVTSNWATSKHWKEIKDMLKPAVEAAVNGHNDMNADRVTSRLPVIKFKTLTAFGYKLEKNSGKFEDVIDTKCVLSDDDNEDMEEDTDEKDNLELRDLGGRFKKFTATSVYVKACALLRNGGTEMEEERKISKELGVKIERMFFQSFTS